MILVIQNVFQFNRTVLGVQAPGSPRALSDAEKVFANACFVEEAGELQDAIAPVDQIDALVDTLYFSIGRAYRLGFEVEDLALQISASLKGVADSYERDEILNIQLRKVKALNRTSVDAIVKRLRFLSESLMTTNGRAGQAHIITQIAATSLFGLHRMNLTAEQARECILLVDKANRTKRKGQKDGRSGEVDAVKPADFVAPETAIAAYLEL